MDLYMLTQLNPLIFMSCVVPWTVTDRTGHAHYCVRMGPGRPTDPVLLLHLYKEGSLMNKKNKNNKREGMVISNKLAFQVKGGELKATNGWLGVNHKFETVKPKSVKTCIPNNQLLMIYLFLIVRLTNNNNNLIFNFSPFSVSERALFFGACKSYILFKHSRYV